MHKFNYKVIIKTPTRTWSVKQSTNSWTTNLDAEYVVNRVELFNGARVYCRLVDLYKVQPSSSLTNEANNILALSTGHK